MAQHRSNGAKDLVITCIKGEGRFLKFWALPLNALETLKSFENHFLNLKSELDSSCGFSSGEQIPVGFKCAVKSKIKHMWCRSRVLAHQGFSTILVQLIDYGNEEIIPVQDVRNVEDQVLSIPPQAVECILADVTPTRGTEWSLEAIHFCEQHLLYNTLSCYVVSEYRKLPVVRVAKKGENEPFVQRLINSGLALIKPETPSLPQPALTYKMNNMDQNSVHLVKVSCVENVHKFYVQLSAAEMELKHLMDNLNRLPRENLTPVKVPASNTPCLAQLASKPCFYRALITAVQQTRCKVFFVDYGYSELKDIQELRAVPPTFMQLAAQAICCSLPREVNIDPDDFKRLINYDHLECHVLNRTTDSYIVKLLRRGQDLLLSSQTYMQQKLNPGAKCEVVVSYVNDLKEFYCQLTHFKDQQNAISSILNSGYNFIPISFPECIPGKPVCVKFSEDNMWYRAQIVKINHENDIEVFFVDFGNCDNVNLSDMRQIGPDALQYPIQAYKCYLFETLLPSDSKAKDDAFDLFEELTTDQCLLAHVNLISGDSGYGITLYSKNSSVSINEKLQSTFLSVPIVPVNDVEKVFVTSFDSASSFFVQFEKLDSGKLSQMQEEINTFYSGSENLSFIPREGSLVCARFNIDEQFYRARVDKFRDGFCEVYFIDYGNRESIPVKDIHSIDASFTKYPQFGTECAFENYPSEIPNDKLSNLILENSIQIKMIRKENDKLYVSLVENFPGNIGLLELFRQHETVMPRSIHGAGLGGYQEKPSIRAPHSDAGYNNNRVSQFSNRNEIKKQHQQEEYPKKRDSPKSDSVKEELKDYSLISIPSRACRNVYVSYVISPSEFYCQIEEDSSKLQLLMKTIEDTYTVMNDTLNFSEFVTDTPCCAIYEDGTWYRGKIKNIGVNSCDIFFVDYGNTSSVSNSKIKKLRNDLFRWPSQAICCKSYNISPKGKDWSEDEINAFINMTLDKSFVAQFVDCDNNSVYSVNLVSIGKLENDIFNKEFVSLGFGRLQDPSKSLILNSHAASSNLSFTPLSVAVGSSEPVEVTYGLNPGEIFCQLKSYEKDFKQMMINLQEHYNKITEAESLIDRPHQGMICVAQFFLDSAWYRAEIKKVEANKIVVFYVDYGNSETVDRKKVRCIIQDYTSLPMQAIKCRIRGISPPGKVWTVNNNLGRHFEGNAICKFISEEGGFFLVDIICNQKDVAQSLISDGLAISDFPASQSEVQIFAENKMPKTTNNASSRIFSERKDSFVSGQLLSVAVSYIENPAMFWCQLLDELDILDQLMADIDSKVSEFVPINSAQLIDGSYCIAQYSEDNAWYRAQIKSLEPENNLKVFFIDYGNSEVVSVSQVKTLPAEFAEYPPQCFRCCLQNAPSKLLPEMTPLFRNTVEEVEEITAKVETFSSDCCTVSLLFDRDDQELNVSELLFGVQEEICETAAAEPPLFLPPDVPLGLHSGYVSNVSSPQDFYIQLAGTEDALADLSVELANASVSSSEVNSHDLSVGYACLSKFSEDNNWYRAEMIAVLDSTVDVLFVDYGNVDTVPKNSLKNLTEKHLQIPPMAIKCKLNGIVPATEEWSDEAINTFQDMVLDECLGITFISKDIPATVNITKGDKEIAQCLVDMELANFESCTETDEAYAEDHLAPPPIEDPLSSLPNDQSYPERKLSSTKLIVKICYVDNYDKFYVTPLELGTELDTVMTTLNILYASNSNSESKDTKSSVPDILEDPKVSMPCVAKYSEDDALYRALITEVDGENIYVTFVDYGNTEITTLKNLRPLTPELVKIPPIALECSLYGIEAVAGQEQEITTKLEDCFVEEVELEMEICEFSPYKIKLNYNGDFALMLIKEGLAKEQEVIVVECEAFVGNSKMTFVDESLEYRIQISKRFFTGVDKIVGNVKFCEIENDLVAFHVVPADLEEELQDLQQKLQDAYSEAPGNLANVACMDFCATKYMEDENWYRAQVLSWDKDKVKVRFIDYGNCETVDKSDIYELLPDFTVEPQFSVKCILFGLKVIKSKEVELQNRLDEYVYHDSVELKLCKYPHFVCDLCISSVVCGDTDISEMIVNEKLVSQQYIISTALDARFEATVQNVECDVIYVLPSNLVKERDSFQSKLQEICKDLDVLSSEVHAYYLYAAKIDDKWYRVSVIYVSDNDVTVNLVDFGSNKVVNASDLVLLPTDICHQPLFLQQCVIEAFGDSTSNIKKIDVQNLSIGSVISCELKKTYPLVHPFIVQIVEIDSNLEEKISCPKTTINEELVLSENKPEHLIENNAFDTASMEQNVDKDSEFSLPEGGEFNESVVDAPCEEDKTHCIEVEFESDAGGSKLLEVEEELNIDKSEFYESENIPSKEDKNEMFDTEFVESENETRLTEGDVYESGFQDLNVDEENKEVVVIHSEGDMDEIFDTEFENKDAVIHSEGDMNEMFDTEFVKSNDKTRLTEGDVPESGFQDLNVNENKEEVIHSEEDKNDIFDTEFVTSEDKTRLTERERDVYERGLEGFNVNEEHKEAVIHSKEDKDEIFDTAFVKSENETRLTEGDVSESGFQDLNVDEEKKEVVIHSEEDKNEMFDTEFVKIEDETKLTERETDVYKSGVDVHEGNKEAVKNAFVNSGNSQKLTKETNDLIERKEFGIVEVEACFEDAKEVVEFECSEKKTDVAQEESDEVEEKNADKSEFEGDTTNKNDEKDSFQSKENLELLGEVLTDSHLSNNEAYIFECPEKKVLQDTECEPFSKYESFAQESDEGNAQGSSSTVLKSSDLYDDYQDLEEALPLNNEYFEKVGDQQTVTDSIKIEPDEYDLDSNIIEQNSCKQLLNDHATGANDIKNSHADLDIDTSFDELKGSDSCTPNKYVEDFESEDVLHSSEDIDKENNRGIEDSYQLSGSVQVKISDIAISDGSVIFAVQPLYLQEDFSLLKLSMQDYYSSGGTAYDGKSNFCVVLHENEWCRAKILLNTGDKWTVMLIDYGQCVSNILSSDVKNVDSEHSNVPPFAVWCTLSSVFCPPEKTETAKTFLCDKLKNTSAVVKILEGGEPYKINIFIDGSSVLNMLLKNSLVTQKLPNMYLASGSYRAKLSFLNVNSKNVEIFVTLSSFSDDYSALCEVMQCSYKLEDSVTNVVELGIYAAYYNDSWYRGTVISSGNEIQVFLVDTGETVCGCKNLCFLLPEHCLQPAFAIPCHIPFSDGHATNEISQSINNVLKAVEFLVNIEVCSDTNTISATLIDEQVVSEVKNMGLIYNVPTDSKTETESSENKVPDLGDTKLLSAVADSSPTAVKVQQQEASEQLVSYLEETFTTESS